MYFIDHIVATVQCCDCEFLGTSSNVTSHVARCHGPEHFQWICAICALSANKYFKDAVKMRKHWHDTHPKATLEQVLHKKLGNHFTKFPYTHHEGDSGNKTFVEVEDSDE